MEYEIRQAQVTQKGKNLCCGESFLQEWFPSASAPLSLGWLCRELTEGKEQFCDFSTRLCRLREAPGRAFADASIPQSPAGQREFKPLSVVQSRHTHKPEVVLLFVCCWGVSGWSSPPPSAVSSFPGPLTFWWLIFWSGRASLAGLRLPGGVTEQGEPGVAGIGKFRRRGCWFSRRQLQKHVWGKPEH